MHFVIIALLASVALAAPTYDSSSSEKEAPILKYDRIQEDDGRYNYEFETGNGISHSQSGSPGDDTGAINKAGHYSYTAPDGTVVEMKFVANENGFQPESPLLPVAPEFPHPIPQFVLDQIAFAAEQDAARARGELSSEEGAYSYN
ncbi:cuticle protein AM/CP1114-like [Portunus trituberculatus]|uniref:cuticle protein AM/CP1114-like n=1 Tax=Portunus trituberculatus TaxID=210409 RepID=UPI001E1CC646|nr:cuticle protein AM/CP1114-like [Portunus trituberculatus]